MSILHYAGREWSHQFFLNLLLRLLPWSFHGYQLILRVSSVTAKKTEVRISLFQEIPFLFIKKIKLASDQV